MQPPEFRVSTVEFFERDHVLRLPFRFGQLTLTHATQAFVRVEIRFVDGSVALGAAAEMMIPKWFDKRPDQTDAANVDDLRRALHQARRAYLSESREQSAWMHFAAHYDALRLAGAAAGLTGLVTQFGQAVLDRALIDALCRHEGVGFAEAMRANLCGITPAILAPDLAGFDMGAFLHSRMGEERIAARHTIGMLDPLREADLSADHPRDGLPVSLERAIQHYGYRNFKIKLGGEIGQDVERVRQVISVVGKSIAALTLDGNEQYRDGSAVEALVGALRAERAIATAWPKISYLEQPIQRSAALSHALPAAAMQLPLLIDESDECLESFTTAQACGYGGVSSKSCKGVYKSLINAARVARGQSEGHALFMSGEDLTMPAGIGVQQDLALAAFIGLPHVERNGHHYINGMCAAPENEQTAFILCHAGLYEGSSNIARLAIREGFIDVRSLERPGFAITAQPDWKSLRPMAPPVQNPAAARREQAASLLNH